MKKNPQPPKRWPHMFDDFYVYKRLNIPNRPDDQAAVRRIAQDVYNVAATEAQAEGRTLRNIFKSANSRVLLYREIRSRLDSIPEIVRSHVEEEDNLVTAIYRLAQALVEDLQADFEGLAATRQNSESEGREEEEEEEGEGEGEEEEEGEEGEEKTTSKESFQSTGKGKAKETSPLPPKLFNYGRPYVVPNGDIQIIREDRPDMPIAIRMSDLLTDKTDPQTIADNGDWISIATISYKLFTQNLTAEGFLEDGCTIWLNHRSLAELNALLIHQPQEGEVRLTSFNFASSILRTVRENFPQLRNPSPVHSEGEGRDLSPLIRPNMTIIVRNGKASGGTLHANQPALARPKGKLGSNTKSRSRRAEQIARYRARTRERVGHQETRLPQKRKATGGQGTETEATGDDYNKTPPTPTPGPVPAANEVVSTQTFDPSIDPRLLGNPNTALDPTVDPTLDPNLFAISNPAYDPNLGPAFDPTLAVGQESENAGQRTGMLEPSNSDAQDMSEFDPNDPDLHAFLEGNEFADWDGSVMELD